VIIDSTLSTVHTRS